MDLNEMYHNLPSENSNATVWPYMAPANEAEQLQVAKAQAARFEEQLRDIAASYSHSTLGIMEQGGAIQQGPLNSLLITVKRLEALRENLENQ